MIIDSHVHIGDRDICEDTILHSKYKDYYRIYSCINPDAILSTEEFLKDVDKYFAIPLFFCETDIKEANFSLLQKVGKDERAIPILLLCKNNELGEMEPLFSYRIMKEHFTLHDPNDISDRDEVYDYLNQIDGFLLLHTLSNSTLNHIKNLRRNFPNLNIILAHLGRNATCDYAYTKNMIDELWGDDRILTDISTVNNIELIEYAVMRYGRERVLFGSDFPFECDPLVRERDFLGIIDKTSLSSLEKEWVLGKSAEQVIQYVKVRKG